MEEPRLTSEIVMRMASAYLARYAASTQHIRQLLERKVRRRFHDAPADLDDASISDLLDTVINRLVKAGLLDDAALASARARSLVRKGLPAWRIKRDLAERGLDAGGEGLTETLAVEAEGQARRYAERKRLGPFRSRDILKFREKDIRAMLRAGFPLAIARRVVCELGQKPSFTDEDAGETLDARGDRDMNEN